MVSFLCKIYIMQKTHFSELSLAVILDKTIKWRNVCLFARRSNMESKALELASRVFTGAAFTSKNLREEAYKHHVGIPPAFVLEFKDSDLMIQWSMVHWTMIKLIKVHYVTIKVTMILYFIQKGTGEDMLRTCVWSTAAAGIKKTNTQ